MMTLTKNLYYVEEDKDVAAEIFKDFIADGPNSATNEVLSSHAGASQPKSTSNEIE